MGSGIYAALSGAIANEARVDVLSHNLANANTVGFQGFKVALETAQGNVENDELTFAGPTDVITDTTAGPLVNTGNPLDLSFSEGVYMQVNDSGRKGYVRGVTLIPSEDGRLLTSEGQQVVDENNETIMLPAGTRGVTVQNDGTVVADGNAVGQLNLVEFENEEALQQDAGRVILDTGAGNPAKTDSQQAVLPGYLEMANVSVVKSMTDLISAQQTYTASTRMIDAFSSMEKKAASSLIG